MTASENGQVSEKNENNFQERISVIDCADQMSPIERKLTKLFKCCFYRDRCFYTSNDPSSFLKHLESKHDGKSASCIYCFYQSGESEPYERTGRLIDHILTHHGFKNFQCNLCVYRGLSISHVLLHQANIHGHKYQSTLSGEGSVRLCKVLVCKQVVRGPLSNEIVYWSNCRVDRITIPPDESPKYQCLYCDFVSLIPHIVFFHICKVHPDYSLCLFDKYVDPLPEIKEAEEKNESKNDEDAELDAIVHDLNTFGTNDDDIDMTPVDEPLAEASGDDSDTETAKEGPARERLFALKGVRIAKKKSDLIKAKKSTSKLANRVEPEPDLDKEEEEVAEEHLSIRKRLMKGFRPEQSAALFAPVALTGSKHSARNMFKCLICADGTQLPRVGIDSHLNVVHNTVSAFKCVECDFVGSRSDINIHFKSIHSSSDATVNYMKFIVALDEKEEASQTISGTVRSEGPSAPKSKKKTNEKDPKNLSSKIKKSLFIGPKRWDEKRKSKRNDNDNDETGEISDSGSDKTIDGGDFIPEREMDVQQDEIIEVDERSKRHTVRGKRKAGERIVASQPIEMEELLEPKTSKERESELFFCLFCNTFSSKNFDEAQTHMKRHLGLESLTCPKCFTYQFSSVRDLREHCENDHPFDYVEISDINTHINYITEFLNEQFIRRRKGDQMNPDQAARYARIICPICERANQLTGDSNYHFTKWKPFKIHFWKHANASFFHCKICRALVPRTRKRVHLEEKHSDVVHEDISEIKDFDPFYHEPLHCRALNCLKSYKLKCKAFYEGRIREEFEIEECRVVLGTELKHLVSINTAIKQEPKDM